MTFVNLIGNAYEFTGKDGNKYFLSPLSLIEWGQYVSWVQWKPYRDALVADLPSDAVEEIKAKCKTGKVTEETASGQFKEFPINLGSTLVRESFNTYDGIGKLLQLSIGINHPELRYKSLGHIVDLEIMNEIQSELLKQNSLDGGDEESEKN